MVHNLNSRLVQILNDAARSLKEKQRNLFYSALSVEHVPDESGHIRPGTVEPLSKSSCIALWPRRREAAGRRRRQGDETNLLGTLVVDVVSHLEAGEAGTPCCGTLQTNLYQPWLHNSQAEAFTTKRSVCTTPQCCACAVVLCSLPLPVQNTHRQQEAHQQLRSPTRGAQLLLTTEAHRTWTTFIAVHFTAHRYALCTRAILPSPHSSCNVAGGSATAWSHTRR